MPPSFCYGVALLNDSKYGYSCQGHVLALSLLRAPKDPDETADMGEQRFRYALFPHAGGPQLGGVIPEAAAFNQPLRVSLGDSRMETRSFFRLDNPAVVLDTIKKAEDSNALILRLYESHGSSQRVNLETTLDIGSAERVDLLEHVIGSIKARGNVIRLRLRPFEILTLKLIPQEGRAKSSRVRPSKRPALRNRRK